MRWPSLLGSRSAIICQVKTKGQQEHGEVWRWLRPSIKEMWERRPVLSAGGQNQPPVGESKPAILR